MEYAYLTLESSVFMILGATVCKLFNLSGGRVLPSSLQLGITTIFVDDNLDKNSSSLSATQHFHGSSVTILQFPTEAKPGLKRIRPSFNSLNDEERKIDFSVVDAYTEVKDSNVSIKTAICPIQTVNIPEKLTEEVKQSFSNNLKEELTWAKMVAGHVSTDIETDVIPRVSYTKYHSQKARDKGDKTPAINSVLPVIKIVSTDPNLQAHIMSTCIDYTKYLNPEQGIAMGCSDQPLYALKKKLQWAYPERFSQDVYFSILGGLHLEQQLLKINGQLISGSGLDDIIDKANLSYIGLKTAFCDVNDIKKALYTIEVVAVCLYKKLNEAHTKSGSSLGLDEWAEAQEGSMFQYWYRVLCFELTTLMLVRSFRECNLPLLLGCLKETVKLCFALDHIHYSRWLSVFINDLEVLYVKNIDVFEMIWKNLGVRTSNADFSKIAYDQRHEMNNKAIKARNGYINLVNKEDSSFLRKLEICSAEVHELLEDLDDTSKNVKHKEEALGFNKTFLTHCNQVFHKMTVNPFNTERFQMLNCPMIFPGKVVEDCMRLFSIGEKQYTNFAHTRFVLGSLDVVHTKLKKNNLLIMKNFKVAEAEETPKLKISSAEFTKLRPACELRIEGARKLFCTEFTNMPECLVDKDGHVYHNDKSDILTVIAPTGRNDKPQNVDGLVIDLSVVIRSKAAVLDTSIYSYAEFADYLLRSIEKKAKKCQVKRLDIVADTYVDLSIKDSTRKSRGMGGTLVFSENEKMLDPKNMVDFLHSSANKTKLNNIITKHAANPLFWKCPGVEIAVSLGERIWTLSEGPKEILAWQNVLFEEADNRMIAHIKDMITENHCKSIQIRTVDTDIVVILLAFMADLVVYENDLQIWVDFGTGDHRRFININHCFTKLGPKTCRALLFMYSFTGCDSTSFFYGRSKSQRFKKLMSYPKKDVIINTFIELSWTPSLENIDENMFEIEKFINFSYGMDPDIPSVNEARYQIFTHSASENLRLLPPSRMSLKLHTLRSAFQAGWVWGNSLQQITCPPLTDWGWIFFQESNSLKIEWYRTNASEPDDISLKKLINTCKCESKKTSCNNCGCAKLNFPCLKFCNCKQVCKNVAN